MCNSAEVAIAGKEGQSGPSPSEGQLAAFWAGILAHRDAARRAAELADRFCR